MNHIYATKRHSQVREALVKNNHALITQSMTAKQHILDILRELQASSTIESEKETYVLLEKEVTEITKVPYERHKLSPTEILKICMLANTYLSEAIKKNEKKYLRASDTGLSRAIVIDGERASFTILSKRYGKLFASGTFKKVTDAIDITTKNGLRVKRVVRLVNKGGRSFHEKELALHKRFGLILTRVDYLSKKWNDEFKTTVIEEAYDHDLHIFTNTDKYPQKNRISIQDLISVLKQIIEQIALMHSEHYAHQDVKTKNVLFKREGDGSVRARLIDFGHASKIVPTVLTKKEQAHHYGTVRYGSPELFATANQLHLLIAQRQAEDMYALGCLMYELLFFKQVPWAKEYYQGVKELEGHAARENALAKQQATYEELKSMYIHPQQTVFEKLGYATARLLDPNPKTRMHSTELFELLLSL